MEAKILDKPPISGDYEEHSFAVSGNTLWVKFLDDEYIEWVGVFSQGEWGSTNKVLPIPDLNLFLVFAGGQGYFIDPNSRQIVSETTWDSVQDVIYHQTTKQFVATDGLRLAIFSGTEMIWSSDRVSADGISITDQDQVSVTGKINDLTDEGCSYNLNLITKEFKAAWILKDNWG